MQAWYGLSDPQTEELIWDSVSLRTFLELSCDGDVEVPEETTICRFRNALMRAGVFERLFLASEGVGGKAWLAIAEGLVINTTVAKGG